ncbi:hypothetical protein [Urechidicola croceus]|uniref:Uncharacterized protein n=1 Tax=Urechidicola croceus TaxID=1850246 RepID=A0A1D8P6Q9_9FLAO|nr:hypothetical protein [Urechidicola croceus]AOW20254.1 hypothetical protein LPB138_05990 [Urechidicola croceus]
MKVFKHKIIWTMVFCSTIVFGQKQEKKINETFSVNKDVIVEINTKHTDVTVETWNRNTVSIEGVWELEGMTKEESNKYFEGWGFEALGNSTKVVITSNSSSDYHEHFEVFDNMDFDFDFDLEPFVQIGTLFNGDFYSEFPESPVPPVPPFPAPVIEHLTEIEFDHEAYEKDKEKYMEEFQKHQEDWEKEFEEKYGKQMKEYEKKMAQWEKDMEPKMKEFELKMEQWEKDNEPKIKAYEKRMEEWGEKFGDSMEQWGEKFGEEMEKWADELEKNFNTDEAKIAKLEVRAKEMEAEIQRKYAEKIKEKGGEMAKKFKIKKSIVIKVPKTARLKMNAKYGKITLPDNITYID